MAETLEECKKELLSLSKERTLNEVDVDYYVDTIEKITISKLQMKVIRGTDKEYVKMLERMSVFECDECQNMNRCLLICECETLPDKCPFGSKTPCHWK